MAVEQKYKPEVRWDQTAFETLQAAWSPERIAEDEKLLQEIFKLAKDSPLLAEALDWAGKHGMKIFVDHTCVNYWGYYASGTGVLAVAQNIAEDPVAAAGTIAHEIRHAWQEYHGLGAKRMASFTDSFTRRALVEADACAVGERVRDQCRAAVLTRENKPVPEELQVSLADEGADLASKFAGWFFTSKLPERYGDYESIFYGQRYKVYPVDDTKEEGGLPERHVEFRAKAKPVRSVINIANANDVMSLGKGFSSDQNYLKRLPRDMLVKDILPASMANTFWGAAYKDQVELTTDIRKAYLRQKLAFNKEHGIKSHRWP